MSYFLRIFTGCAICFLGVLAGLQFAKGNISTGIFDLILAATNIPNLVMDFDD